ncbi:MAG TPA: serine/threonine-protein phosphatase, partial [Rhabdochlamydiaceae bacterium]|nr:serine/threonine-protein phosphatase [Rhabdochlamydiaceae bacterium]
MNLMLPLIESYGISDIGGRNNNEDVWAELPDDHFYVVADGMGGHLAGEVASKEAVLSSCDSIEKFFRKHPQPSVEAVKKLLKQALSEANTSIRSLAAKHPDF